MIQKREPIGKPIRKNLKRKFDVDHSNKTVTITANIIEVFSFDDFRAIRAHMESQISGIQEQIKSAKYAIPKLKEQAEQVKKDLMEFPKLPDPPKPKMIEQETEEAKP